MESKEQLEDYYRFFHYVVTLGIASGLRHPVEWLINAHRVPGGTLAPEYYQRVEKNTPRFLTDIFDSLNFGLPNSADDILNMCDEVYPERHLCKGYFQFLKTDIEKYLESFNKKSS